MGCDIHGVFQKKVNDKWQDVPTTFEFNRHYYLFSVLADVRNGFGFAGVPTYKPVKPISEPKGLPDDFEGGENHPIADDIADKWELEYKDIEGLTRWMGEHSYSWLTDEELLNYKECDLWRCGIVDIEFFNAWDGFTAPESWSGGISGKDIFVANSPVEVVDETTHVRIFWKSSGDLSYFFDEVRRLKELHGEIRFVFGFDN